MIFEERILNVLNFSASRYSSLQCIEFLSSVGLQIPPFTPIETIYSKGNERFQVLNNMVGFEFISVYLYLI